MKKLNLLVLLLCLPLLGWATVVPISVNKAVKNQNFEIINFNLKSVTLEKVFDLIEKQTDKKFIYAADVETPDIAYHLGRIKLSTLQYDTKIWISNHYGEVLHGSIFPFLVTSTIRLI